MPVWTCMTVQTSMSASWGALVAGCGTGRSCAVCLTLSKDQNGTAGSLPHSCTCKTPPYRQNPNPKISISKKKVFFNLIFFYFHIVRTERPKCKTINRILSKRPKCKTINRILSKKTKMQNKTIGWNTYWNETLRYIFVCFQRFVVYYPLFG